MRICGIIGVELDCVKPFEEGMTVEEEKRKIYTVVALVAVVSLLLSCILGALAGGVAGFVVGRRQAKVAAGRALEGGLSISPRLQVPIPWQQGQPRPWYNPGEEGPVQPPEVVPQGREGALLRQVIAGSPADEAGLQAGDIVVAVDRTSIDQNHELADVVGRYKPGDLVTIRFVRGDQENSVKVKLGEQSNEPGQPYLGVRYTMIAKPEQEAPSD
jgi:membrane-associated protease RseP (regulator of RpoE activity)